MALNKQVQTGGHSQKYCKMLSQNVYVKISVFVQVQCDQCVFTVLFYSLSGILLGILPIEFCLLKGSIGFCMRYLRLWLRLELRANIVDT